MFLQNVKCLRYGTLRYVRVENTHKRFGNKSNRWMKWTNKTANKSTLTLTVNIFMQKGCNKTTIKRLTNHSDLSQHSCCSPWQRLGGQCSLKPEGTCAAGFAQDCNIWLRSGTWLFLDWPHSGLRSRKHDSTPAFWQQVTHHQWYSH